MSITLGSKPEELTVVLTVGADFSSTLTNKDGNWPGGAQIELRLGTTTWTADITGADATFNVDAAEVDTVIASKKRSAKLYYIDGTTEVCWAIGSVQARD